MRAVVVSQYDGLPVVTDVEPLPLRPNDVCVRVTAAGVCHSDISAARGRNAFPLPMILGHEGTGVVEAVGARVTDVEPGDRVVASWVPACGRCFQCVRCRMHLCETQLDTFFVPRATRDGVEAFGMAGLGTMADHMTVHESNLVRVSTTLPDAQLVLIGCTITTGVGAALWTAEVEVGSTVAIFGCGGVGLSIVQGANIAGAAEIIAIDPVASRRAAAERYGATATVDPAVGSAVDLVLQMTGGRGAEYAFEAIGRPDTMRDAFVATCKGGVVTYVGALEASAELVLPANAVRAEGKQIRGCTYGSAQVRLDMPKLAALAESGRLDLASMVSRQMPLEGINDAFYAMEAGDGVRSILIP